MSSGLFEERLLRYISARTTTTTPTTTIVSTSTTTTNVPSSTSSLMILTRRVRTSTSTPEITSTRNVRVSTRNVRTSTNARHVYEVFGRPPASSSVVAMLPRVSVVEKGVCVICLEEWRKDDIVTELPCEHKYHSECVEKWLGIHATCPQCRYEIPLEDDEVSVDSDEHFSDYDFDLMSQTND